MVKYVFGPLTFGKNWKLSLFETIVQFSLQNYKMHEFSSFNKILLSLFDI